MPEDGADLSTRRVRIAAVIGGIILTIGLAVAVGSASGRKPDPVPSTTPPVAAAPQSPPPPSPSSPPSPTVAGSPSSSPARPVVRWRGSVTVTGPSSEKDLDSVPPRSNASEADVRGGFAVTDLKADHSGVQIAPLSGSAGFTRCRDAVFTSGVDQVEQVQKGDVLCVLTSQGRVALLKTRVATSLTFPEPTLKFDVTVWDPPVQASGG